MKILQLLVVILSALFIVSCKKEQPDPDEKPDITGQTGTLTDIDGNTYNWIGIGAQAWMAENLKVTHYADGTPITYIGETGAWRNKARDAKAYCWYENLTENRDVYGALYTWAAALNGTAPSDAPYPICLQGVCPDGWHLPTDQNWKELEMHLGMSFQEANEKQWRGTDEGEQLKENGNTHWAGSSGEANESGFTALPGGERDGYGHFTELGTWGHFWSSTLHLNPSIWTRKLYYGNAGVYRSSQFMQNGFSVRCVRD